MSDTITLTGLRGYGHHGVFDFERENGQEFVVDVEISTSFQTSAKTDDVAHTINYAEVAELAYAHITGTPVNLIETLAVNIAKDVKKLPGVDQVKVTVHKPQAPIEKEFADVSVTAVR